MSTPTYVVVLVLGILVLQILVWIPIVLWMRSKTRALIADMTAELEASGERLVRGPESAVYRGSTGSFSKLRGNGVIALTDRRLVFRPLVGKGFEVLRTQVTGRREATVFAGAYRGAQPVTILALAGDGEIGFLLKDRAAWEAPLASLAPMSEAPR